jgi:peptide subunit release factor 1 (eRF1)
MSVRLLGYEEDLMRKKTILQVECVQCGQVFTKTVGFMYNIQDIQCPHCQLDKQGESMEAFIKRLNDDV